MVEAEIPFAKAPDVMRRNEAINRLSQIYDKLKPGSVHRQDILKCWFGLVTDTRNSSYVIALLYDNLASPTNTGATPNADLRGFSAQEKKLFISNLRAVTDKTHRQKETQALIELLGKTARTEKRQSK
jgi:hypothetical protein